MPGLRFSIAYWPVPSVTPVRTFSINAGLAASTVTPGSTAPETSLTTPLMVACAEATTGSQQTNPNAAATLPILSTALLHVVVFQSFDSWVYRSRPLAPDVDGP